jgi:hypothetical protein
VATLDVTFKDGEEPGRTGRRDERRLRNRSTPATLPRELPLDDGGWALAAGPSEQAADFFGDLLVFPGPDHQDTDPAPGGGDVPVPGVSGSVAFRVDAKVEESETGAGLGPDAGCMLAHAPGEDDGVETAHGRGHGGDAGSEAMQVDRQGEPGSFVAIVGRGHDGADVT